MVAIVAPFVTIFFLAWACINAVVIAETFHSVKAWVTRDTRQDFEQARIREQEQEQEKQPSLLRKMSSDEMEAHGLAMDELRAEQLAKDNARRPFGAVDRS